MTVPAASESPSTPEAQTRGFLFADVRGYTEYLERQGATAAAALLARYRAIVRAAIAEFNGAEIRTEGDSFYVVLPSASVAVRCALSIVERVEQENQRQPGEAIRVGIGVHAGEAIETDEGLVGSAVNIAARLSALAKPGEVLVSETVRALTRSVVSAQFVPRGRHRLKGVAEAQEVFAAVPSGAPIAKTRARWQGTWTLMLLAVAVLISVALVYVAANGLYGRGAGPTASLPGVSATPTAVALASPSAGPSQSSTPASARPSGSGGPEIIHVNPSIGPLLGGYTALSAGGYRFSSFKPVLEFDVDPTWQDRAWYPLLAGSDMAALFAGRPGVDTAFNPFDDVERGMVILDFVRLQTVVGNPCDPGDTKSYRVLGGNPSEVVDWLSAHEFLSATNVQPVAVAGWTGLSVDVTVTGDPGKACSGVTVPGQGSVNLFKTATHSVGYTGVFKIHDGDEDRFAVLDVGEQAPLVLISQCNLNDCASLLPWAQDLIDTIGSVDSSP